MVSPEVRNSGSAALLCEYLVKGFTMDDERLKNPPGPGHGDYSDELLERIREIRASERRFSRQVLDMYATSIDDKPVADHTQAEPRPRVAREPTGFANRVGSTWLTPGAA